MIEYNQRATIFNSVNMNFLASFKKLKAKAALIYQKQKTRKELEDLPEYLYQDINLNKKQIKLEINKPFWK